MVGIGTVLWLLVFQGALGALDVLWNHEWREQLPRRPGAALEQWIHGVRELLYAVVFAGLAWLEWRGAWAALLAAILVVEIALTAWDFVVEDRTRVLSPAERVTHLVLSMTGGAYVALLVPHLWAWFQLPGGLVARAPGVLSWILSVEAIGVFAWGCRDLASSYRLRVPAAAHGSAA